MSLYFASERVRMMVNVTRVARPGARTEVLTMPPQGAAAQLAAGQPAAIAPPRETDRAGAA